MIIFVDIDETICFYEEAIALDGKKDYNTAIPSSENIAKVNKLYEATFVGSPSTLSVLRINRQQLKYGLSPFSKGFPGIVS